MTINKKPINFASNKKWALSSKKTWLRGRRGKNTKEKKNKKVGRSFIGSIYWGTWQVLQKVRFLLQADLFPFDERILQTNFCPFLEEVAWIEKAHRYE